MTRSLASLPNSTTHVSILKGVGNGERGAATMSISSSVSMCSWTKLIGTTTKSFTPYGVVCDSTVGWCLAWWGWSSAW